MPGAIWTLAISRKTRQQIELCLPYATHTHIRDFYGQPRQPLDLDRIWPMFAKSGYNGYMSAEYEGTEDAMVGVPKLIEKIKALCRKYSSTERQA